MKIRELAYTSAQRGLRPGSGGFCSVMMTRGLAVPAVELLERLSNNYQVIYLPYDARARDNPVAFSLVKARAGSQSLTVLSRICAAGADHTGRSNILAHHLLPEDVNPGFSPIDAAGDPGSFLTNWSGEPSLRDSREIEPFGEAVTVCSLWKQIAGSERWAGRLVQTWLGEAPSPLYLIYPAGTNMLALLREAVGILPQNRQWSATFATYYCGLPPEVTCQVRCVMKGAPQEAEARRGDFLDLSNLLAPVPSGRWADRAAGIISVVPATRPALPVVDTENQPASFPVAGNPVINVLPLIAGTSPLEEQPPPVSAAPIRRVEKASMPRQGDGRFSPAVMARTPLSYVLSPPGWLFWLTVLLMGGCLLMVALSKTLGEVLKEAEKGKFKEQESAKAAETPNDPNLSKSEHANPALTQLTDRKLHELHSEIECIRYEADLVSKDNDAMKSGTAKLLAELTAKEIEIDRLRKMRSIVETKPPPKFEADQQARQAIFYLQELNFINHGGDYPLPTAIVGFQFGSARIVSFWDVEKLSWKNLEDSHQFDIGQESLQWKIKPRKQVIPNPKFRKETKSDEKEFIEKTVPFSQFLEELNDRYFFGKKTALEFEVITRDGVTRKVYLNLVFPPAKKKNS